MSNRNGILWCPRVFVTNDCRNLLSENELDNKHVRSDNVMIEMLNNKLHLLFNILFVPEKIFLFELCKAET